MQFPRSAVFKNPCFKLKLIKTKRIEVSYTILRKSPQVLHNKSLKSIKIAHGPVIFVIFGSNT